MNFISRFVSNLAKIRHNDIPEHFGLNVALYKAAGTWIPNIKETNSIKYKHYFYNWFVLLTAGQFIFFEAIKLPTTYNENLTAFTKNFGILLNHMLSLVKVVFWIRNHKHIFQMLKKLDDMTRMYDDYEVSPIKSEVYKRNFYSQIIMAKYKALSDFFLKFHFSGVTIMAILAGFLCTYRLLFDAEGDYFELVDVHNITRTRFNQLLPLYSAIPFDYQKGRFAFFWAVVYQLYGFAYYAMNVVAFDSLFASIMSFLSGNLMVAKGAFRTIRGRCLNRLNINDDNNLEMDRQELQVEMLKEFKIATQHLQLILIAAETLEDLFSTMAFMQLGLSLAAFCSNLYIISSIPFSSRLTEELIYLMAVLNQLLMYCFFGHGVTENAETIPDAIYEGEWVRSSQIYKRQMIFTMLRMSKPVYITVGKFAQLSIPTFVAVCRLSYSSFSVLKAQS